MSSLAIPTDNLYKFIAISGLALLIFTLIFPRQKIWEIHKDVNALKTEVKVLGAEVSAYKDILESKEKTSIDKGRMLIELQKKLAALYGKNDELRALFEQLKETIIYFKVGFIVSTLMTFIGFILWYFKIQRHEDALYSNKNS